MPIDRQEIGRKFKVGEYEGYIHVGMFPEGDPGDVFVDIAKEGTTLAGLMNAFMIAVSVGIQYGVPLEVFVVEVRAHALRAERASPTTRTSGSPSRSPTTSSAGWASASWTPRRRPTWAS